MKKNPEQKKSCSPRCWFAKRDKCECICKGANHKASSKFSYNLPPQHSFALLLHEVGHHLIYGGTEEEANKIIKDLVGIKIKYIKKTPYGNRLQYIKSNSIERAYKFLGKFIESQSLHLFIY